MYWEDSLILLGSSPIVVFQQNCNPDFLFVELLEEYDQVLSADTLYFASLSTLCSKLAFQPEESKPLSVMLFCDREIPPEISATFDNIACFHNFDQFLESFYLLRKGLYQLVRYNNQVQEFMEMIAREDDVSKMIQWVGQFFNHPVSLVDNSFTYLAHSGIESFERFGSAELMVDIKRGYVSPDHIKILQHSHGANLFRQTSTMPILIKPPGENFQHYHVPIPIGNTIAGAFCVFLHMDEDLDSTLRLYLKRIARLISIALQRIDFYALNKASVYSTFFTAMIDGVPDPSKLWEARLAAYGFQLLPSMHIIAAQVPRGVQKHAELLNLATTMHQIFPGSIYYIRNDKILLLCSNKPGQFSAAYARSQGDDFYDRSNLKLGISSEFHSIYDMAIYYNEALIALELGTQLNPHERLYLYDNIRVYDMVHRMAQNTDIMSYCYPPFIKLFNHDKENATQLGRTLYHYLSNIKNPAEVCRILNIHKNTLYFRLDKIRSIMNVDFTKLSISSQIFVTIVILRYLNEIQEKGPNLSEFHINEQYSEAKLG